MCRRGILSGEQFFFFFFFFSLSPIFILLFLLNRFKYSRLHILTFTCSHSDRTWMWIMSLSKKCVPVHTMPHPDRRATHAYTQLMNHDSFCRNASSFFIFFDIVIFRNKLNLGGVIVVGHEHGDPSSNPGRGCLYFTLIIIYIQLLIVGKNGLFSLGIATGHRKEKS